MKTRCPSFWMIGRACLPWAAALALVLVSGCTPPNYNRGSGNATVWIEFPPNGQILPDQPVAIVIYATDDGGVTGLSLKVNGMTLPVQAPTRLSPDGYMVRLDQTWYPLQPTQGQYTLTASTSGASASVTFCIVTCQTPPEIETGPDQTEPYIAVTPTWTPTAALPFITLPPDAQPVTPGAPSAVTVEFYASPPYVNAGNCSTLHWDVSGTDQVYLDGAFVYFRGMQEYCPCETETHTLRVIDAGGASKDYTAGIEAYGSCSAPPVTEPPTEPPPSDTDGPNVDWSNLVFEGCQFYGQAGLSDASGVSWAKFYFNKNSGGWKSVWMSEVSSGTWQSEAGISLEDGIGTPMGTIEYYITAGDTLGNESEGGGGSYNYTGCGG